ncbi:MAG: thiopeptide-type bacteriocin biosynthesis protein [Lachnospiraceae bacterium]
MYPLIKYEDTSSRILFPGEEWLYINLYCPENTQNELLRNKVVPFADKLVLEGILQKWFFIRYDDGKPHIRLRLRVNETKNIGGLLNKVLDWLKDCKNGEIFDANIKSYERESARYGGPQLIEMAESVFWRDSQLVIKMLDIFEHESVDNQKF